MTGKSRKIDTGDIVVINNSDAGTNLLVVISRLDDLSCLGLPVFENSGTTELSVWSIVLNENSIQSGKANPLWFIDVQRPLVFSKDCYLNTSAALTNSFFSELLRMYTKHSSKVYYDHHANKPASPKIPVSGKVLDEQDLYNMVDASLDMWLTTGRFNDQFQNALEKYMRARYVLTVNSGSSANLLAITTLTSPVLGEKRLKEGDEVITVAAGFPTTINPIIQNKLIPVFIDIDPETYNINVNQIEDAITSKTKAIIVAHTLGNPFDLSAISALVKKYNLWLIEDNCDALGAKYGDKLTGTFGHLATLSFYPAHHITMGEGGALIINDSRLYKIAMSYRDWGRDCWCDPGKDDTCGKRFKWQLGNLPSGYDHKYIYSHIGYNLKITDWQAAVGLSQLKKLPGFIQKRTENFDLLYKGLEKFKKYLMLPKATEGSEPSWFGFLITVKENYKFSKNDLVNFLEENKIATRQLFAGNILRQPAYLNSDFKLRIRDSAVLSSADLTDDHYKLLPNSDVVMNNTFWIGLGPLINPEMIKKMIAVFNSFFENYSDK